MSTPNTRHAIPTLDQIHAHLLEIDPALRTHSKQPVALAKERLALEGLNTTLKRINGAFAAKTRALYQGLEQADLTQATGQNVLGQLKQSLKKNLQDLDETSTVEGQSRKTYLTFTAGISALEQETRLNVSDYLLSPADLLMLEDSSRGPSLRPGMYALTFTYQEQTVAFAGAFVLTRQASPTVDSLDTTQPVGPVLLFTPSRGLEAFDSLQQLDLSLKAVMAQPSGRTEFNRHLPVAYQHLEPLDLWPLALQPIEGEPVFEHAYKTLLAKREHDISHALSLAENSQLDAAQLKQHLDNAVDAALPDLSLRLDFRAQRLLERTVYNALPDWYRSAGDARRETLHQHLQRYNQARQTFLDLFGPAATPQALARHQWAEQLADELDIHHLDPDLLHITTRRSVPLVGTYDQRRSLVDLALRGLHPGDSTAGSTFLKNSTLIYAGAPLDEHAADLTPQNVITLLQDLQPRLDFATTQKTALGSAPVKQAARDFFDRRLVAMAYIASLQNHLTAADLKLFEQLREHPRAQLCAQTVMLHGAQLNDVWLLRDDDANGQVKRLLLCTPDAPSAQQFFAFDSLRECQTHIIGWLDNASRVNGRTLRDYLLEQVPLRFRPKMNAFMQGISLRPDAEEHVEVTFGKPCNHADCLDAMASHRLAMQLDDYELGSPAWYRAASPADRARLASLGDDAAGALRVYNARPDAEVNFPSFELFLHQRAKLSLNTLLGRDENDVDPDSVFADAPKPSIGVPPLPISYTTLYRDGYVDGIGFLDGKFSAAATFRGPEGVDLSPLTAKKVARSITGRWIGERYCNEVRQRLQRSESPGYGERRNAVLAIQQLQMKSAALESRLRGHIASVDLAWLEQAIDSLSATGAATRNTYKVHRLFIDGNWVIGNYLFSHGTNAPLLYTPDAPDGISFRLAKLFNYLLKKVEGMLAYWNARVPSQSMSRVGMFLQNASDGLPSDINRTTPSPARHDGVSHITPLTDLRHEFYNMKLQRRIDDVQASTVNRIQMITGILWTCVEWVTAVATMPFPTFSLTLGGLLAFKDAMFALNAYHQNDPNAALQHYIGYLANIGGAVLFDVRPALSRALKTLRPMLNTQSALIGQLENLKPDNMQAVLFDGQAVWAPQHPDALGRYLLYRHDPATGQLHSTARLVNQNADHQWMRSGVAGGGRKKYEQLVADESSPLEQFHVAPDQAKTLRTLFDPQFRQHLEGIGEEFGAGARSNAYSQVEPLRLAYIRNVEQLSQRTDTFFNALPVPAPKAPAPALATDATHADILSTLFSRDKRLLVGASNTSIASKQLLIEQLPALAEQGLKRLYIENLPRDLFHRKLKILNNQLAGNKAKALQQIEHYLARVDQDLGFAVDAPFTYRKLALEAYRLNIALDGLDAAASYHMEHILALGEGPHLIPRSSKLRNFYSHSVLENTLKNNPGEGWLALVESNRLGTYERIAGLADLQKTLALRVEDAGPGQPTGLWPDNASAAQSRGDYRLAMPSAHAALRMPGATSTPAATATHFAEFDIPHGLRPDIDQMRMGRRGLDTRYAHANPRYVTALSTFSQTRERLRTTAAAFFADLTTPQRGTLADIAKATNEAAFFERVYAQRLGLVIGEAHSAQSSKRLLIDAMKQLKKQGVKTLYIEHLLTDLHQEALDTFHSSLKMSPLLDRYLSTLDSGHMPGYRGPYTFTHVLKAANKYGIRVRALDCTASYHVKGINGHDARAQLFNYFANEVIKADQLAQGPHKWVAFMGSTHTDMHLGVPGIVQLQDAVSLHVRDTPPALAKPLHSGSWEIVDEGQGVALHCDFKIETGIPGVNARRFTPPPERSRLTEPGDFIVERPTATETNLVHFSRSNEIVVTPIQIDDNGKLFIERWDVLRQHRFHDLTQLIAVLNGGPPGGMGLRQIS